MLGKIRVYLIMFAAFSAFAGVAYWYYKDTQQALQEYASNQSVLETSLNIQQQTTELLLRDLSNLQQITNTLNTDFQDSRIKFNQLQDKFNRNSAGNSRDFGALAEAKPALVQKSVNNATQDVFRCIELLSGATIGPDELENDYLVDCTTKSTDSMQ